MAKTKEKDFESEIEEFLIDKNKYIKCDPKTFNKEMALDSNLFLEFIKSTQPNEYTASKKIHQDETDLKIINRLNEELENRGMLDVLRRGITDYGVKYKVMFFKPISNLNPETIDLYNKNIFSITRQLKYSLRNENSLDMVISINGLPLITIELKNPFTGQTVDNAKKQYIYDRDPTELIFRFKKRTLVHFAVDPDTVYMTTKLNGKNTKYLPFNKGFNNGAGNPNNPDGDKTAYLWEQIFTKDSLSEIIEKFIHIQVEKYMYDNKEIKDEKLLFPRYHQLDVVRKLSADIIVNGVGKNYLIQHSAGSGKSNSIAWLSYRLSNLHKNDIRVFDSIIVITDRKVLDKQLQDTIYEFDHKQGVVQRIDQDSNQLAECLVKGTHIIITTLQKFPYVLEKIDKLPARNYAVIIDEAHSSQGGEASKKMKEVLTITNLEEQLNELNEDYEDESEEFIQKSMLSRGKQKNLSFFAFTATPKYRTLEVFGEIGDDKTPHPFHLYSMKQAIEEGFILDVLQNYMTYSTYYRVTKKIEDDPNVDKKKAVRAIARFVSLHPHNISQKIEVIVEHFRQITMTKIGGKAKAMVVTPSRLHVIKYKQALDAYIKEQGYKDIRALVAFSGVVKDEFGLEYKETIVNGFGEKELPDKFNTSEYQLLLVADKYQTGYDQPLLHTMYIDKKLSGVKAVQTLSRLNRVCPGKEDTFILDFVNKDTDIYEAFKPYYEVTMLEKVTDPNRLYDLKNELDASNVYNQGEIDNFSKVFFKPKEKQDLRDHSKLNSLLDPAINKYNNLNSEELKENFKHTSYSFLRAYSFLGQIVPFMDSELEKLYGFLKLLVTKLPKRNISDQYKLGDEIALEYYRLQKIKEGTIHIDGEPITLSSPSEAGFKKEKDLYAKLSEIITVLNDKFGTDFTDADRLFFDQIEEDMVSDEKLSLRAKSNNIDNFKFSFDDVLIDKLIGRMDQNQEIFKKMMDNTEFRKIVGNYLLNKVYNRLK